ncbi:MAG: hypothetical protein KKF46_07815 [Nanoarchaeota archaeon]|nr:hypothetical protein [Nanoarchaeota archaeon]MBU1322234.1 hypothetical protein [Nanoarchaeota archaeon]MBU1598043.1 hypothetical protein [Nanoarchaeota archaeon]MBU2442048.1 hypothetical protein [Nanoarchaeota archaeon]
MKVSELKQVKKQAEQQYKKYEHEPDYYPQTQSTLGVIMIGDIAVSKGQYERAYESYWEVLRRIECFPLGGQKIDEAEPEEYKQYALTRLERLVKKIDQDKTFTVHKYKHRHYGLGEIKDLAKELIEKYNKR